MRRPNDRHIRWAAEVVTFYRPDHWELQTPEELASWASAHPRSFWDRLLDEVATCNVDFVELCFEPGDWKGLAAAYGSAAGAKEALVERDLALSGSYQGGGHRLEAAIGDSSLQAGLVDEVRRHAAFIRELGAQTVMTGPPRRFPITGSYEAEVPPEVHDQLARVFDEMGRATAAEDVRLVIHTESMSCVCRPQDVAAILSRTDPQLVGLCLDAGHVTLDGGDPASVLEAHGERVSNVHWKDAAGPLINLPPDGMVTHELMMERFRPAGAGIVDWRGVTSALRLVDFNGFAAVEYDLAPDPVRDTRAVLARFDAEFAGLYR